VKAIIAFIDDFYKLYAHYLSKHSFYFLIHHFSLRTIICKLLSLLHIQLFLKG